MPRCPWSSLILTSIFWILSIFAKFQSKNKRGTFSCCHHKYFSEYSVFFKISQNCLASGAFFSESGFFLLPNLAKKRGWTDVLKFSQYFERLYLVNIFNSVPIWNFYNWPIFQMISLLEIQLILWKWVNCENLSIFYSTFLSGKTQSKSCRKVKVEVCWQEIETIIEFN